MALPSKHICRYAYAHLSSKWNGQGASFNGIGLLWEKQERTHSIATQLLSRADAMEAKSFALWKNQGHVMHDSVPANISSWLNEIVTWRSDTEYKLQHSNLLFLRYY